LQLGSDWFSNSLVGKIRPEKAENCRLQRLKYVQLENLEPAAPCAH
jgi:hypothetical protein